MIGGIRGTVHLRLARCGPVSESGKTRRSRTEPPNADRETIDCDGGGGEGGAVHFLHSLPILPLPDERAYSKQDGVLNVRTTARAGLSR